MVSETGLVKLISDVLTKISPGNWVDESPFFVGVGAIDSVGFISLIMELEGKLAVDIDLSDYDPNEFSTVLGLARCLRQELEK